MTIINMVGGGGSAESPEVISDKVNLYIEGKYENHDSTSTYTMYVTYQTSGNNIYKMSTENSLSLCTTSTNYASSGYDNNGLYKIRGTMNTITKDTLGEYIKSTCPEGKTFNAVIYGRIAFGGVYGLVGSSGYDPVKNHYIINATGNSNTISYSGLPTGSVYGTKGKSGYSYDYNPMFTPLSVMITYT